MVNSEQLDDTGAGGDCGVLEKHFPCIGKCYSKDSPISSAAYKSTCQYFSTWTSLPDGASLEITYIFDCSLYGYGKRIKE